MTATLLKYFKDPSIVVDLIYKNGDLEPKGYGFLSGGFGGGLEIKEFHDLLYIRGFFHGISENNKRDCHTMLKEINAELVEKYGVSPDSTPFINLTEAA